MNFTPPSNIQTIAATTEPVHQSQPVHIISSISLPDMDTSPKETNSNDPVHTAKIRIDQQPSLIQMDVESIEGQMKRVKFCKTEIHFTAETGRICIVETDTKPPAMKLQRRSRYRSHTVERTNVYPKSMTSRTELVEPTAANDRMSMSTSSPKTVSQIAIVNRSEAMQDNVDDIDSNGGVESIEDEVRGILKNRLVKPKTYLFGENYNAEMGAKFWGVRLKPVSEQSNNLRPSSHRHGDYGNDDSNKRQGWFRENTKYLCR